MKLSSRWCDEIDTYRTIKSAFILEGDILDLHMWVNEAGLYSLTLLDNYLFMYLSSVGYRNIVFYNRVDGFYNNIDTSGEMLKEYLQLSGISQGRERNIPSIGTALAGVRAAMRNQQASCAVIINLSSLLTTNPEHMDHSEVEYFATLLLAMREAMKAPGQKQGQYLNNIFLLLVNKVNDLPAWLYLNNPYIKVVTVSKPSRDERKILIEGHRYSAFDIDRLNESEIEKIEKQIVGITDGFTAMELDRLLLLCHQEQQLYRNYPDVINAYRFGQKDDPWGRLRSSDLSNLEAQLSNDVKGQSVALRAAADVIKRAASGLSGLQHSSYGRPKGVLFLAGPTGTGKTELAKSLARIIFGDESALLRFDMSEYGHAHSDQRLLGAPPGYVGYDEGGELTNAVKLHPFSIVLFDEIEKAHPSILDKFLQILDDGRMTDSKGETVYFSETLLVFTSNKGIYGSTTEGERIALVSSGDPYEIIENTVVHAIRDYFIADLGRPEILNRIGNNLIVFDFIRPEVVHEILRKQVQNVFKGIEESRNITIKLEETDPAWATLIERSTQNLEFGGRGIGNVVEKYLLNPLARKLTDENWPEGSLLLIKSIQNNQGDISLELVLSNSMN